MDDNRKNSPSRYLYIEKIKEAKKSQSSSPRSLESEAPKIYRKQAAYVHPKKLLPQEVVNVDEKKVCFATSDEYITTPENKSADRGIQMNVPHMDLAERRLYVDREQNSDVTSGAGSTDYDAIETIEPEEDYSKYGSKKASKMPDRKKKKKWYKCW